MQLRTLLAPARHLVSTAAAAMAQQQPARELAFRRALCLYHYPCPDGVFAALALHRWHAAHGRLVAWFPNTTWAPVTVDALGLQV